MKVQKKLLLESDKDKYFDALVDIIMIDNFDYTSAEATKNLIRLLKEKQENIELFNLIKMIHEIVKNNDDIKNVKQVNLSFLKEKYEI